MRARTGDVTTIEETFVGKAMFPRGILKGDQARAVEVHTALAHTVDTALVFMMALEGYSVFWCQELMSVVLRARPNARPEGFDVALAEAADQCRDASVQALIVDLRESPEIYRPTTTEEWGLEDFGRRILVIHADFEGDIHHDDAHLYGFSSFQKATAWARREFGNPSNRPRDAVASLATNTDAKLVAANYVAAIYWLSKTSTLAVVYSGQELEQEAASALLMAVSEYLKHLRALSVIVDLRHRINVERSWLGELSTAVAYLQSRGAEHFIVVGSHTEESAEDPVQAYLEILAHASVKACLVKTFEHALTKTAHPRAKRKLAS